MKKKICIVSNKWWECDPIMSVLLNANAIPGNLNWPSSLHHPRPRPDQTHLQPENPQPVPRAIFELENCEFEIWCISDLLEHLPDKPQYQSSSEVKMRYMPKIFYNRFFDLVVAIGTASYPHQYSENGNVCIGTNIFIHNCHPNGSNPNSNWQTGQFDTIISSKIDFGLFDAFTTLETSPQETVANKFMNAPLNGASYPKIISNYKSVALGSVNVTDYSEYATTDSQTVQNYTQQNNISKATSLETTHGLIRVSSDAPFIYISGITDRVGFFDSEVTPRSYSQNTVAAHNAGIVLAWLMPKINSLL